MTIDTFFVVCYNNIYFIFYAYAYAGARASFHAVSRRPINQGSHPRSLPTAGGFLCYPQGGPNMTIIDVLEQNAIQYPKETALVEINPQFEQSSRITWRDYALIQPEPGQPFRREITWTDFDQKANRFANLLLTRGCKKGDKVAILLMNSIEWLPIYFGILKAGAVVVPLNYRYTAEEIKYCLDKADCSMLVFGPEFIGRIEQICDRLPAVKNMFYVGEDCPLCLLSSVCIS